MNLFPSGEPSNAWGSGQRYYAAEGSVKGQVDDDAAKHWREVLDLVAPGTRESVERTFKQWNGILRDYLRTETALRLTVGDEAQAVPVRIVDGMPSPFIDAIRHFDGIEWLLLNRPVLVDTITGTRFMAVQADAVRLAWGDKAGSSDSEEIQRVLETASAWLSQIDRVGAIKTITEIDEDVLGAYYFRIPEIQLYWVVIGIIARALGVSAEALTVVVLAHELAHAYTHLGRDIDNERWNTDRFAQTDLGIVEGLAQFYTQTICRRLESRMPSAIAAFEALLDRQSETYKTHRGWLIDGEQGGEVVRVTMIECRSRAIISLPVFAESIKRHRLGVRGRKE